MTEKQPLDRQTMANRLAMEFHDGWVVNLGIGIPTLCSNFVHPDRHVVFQSENGLVNYGPLAERGEEDPNLVNAGGQYVVEMAGMAILDHADSFALIRGGYVDVTVLGAYEVAANGDFANWKVAGAKGGGIGGAMDLAVGAKNVFLALEAHDARRQAAARRALRAARHRGRRRQARRHEPRPVRDHGAGLPAHRDRARLHARRRAGCHGRTAHYLTGIARFSPSLMVRRPGVNPAMLYLSQAVSGRRTGWIRSTGWNGWPHTTR